MVLSSDFSAWNRPSQPLSYSVFRPNGAFTPIPKSKFSLISVLKYMLGTNAKSPAFPPSPPRGLAPPATEPWLLNSALGLIKCKAPTACVP